MARPLSADSAPAESAEGQSWAVRARGLRKVYRSTVAVDSVDFDVPQGAVVGMLGPNGSGKTTTIRMMLGLVRPTDGSVEVFGEPMPDGAATVLPHVGSLVEGPGFHPFLSGIDNLLRFAAAEPLLSAQQIPSAVADAIEVAGLTHAASRRYRSYSLGMKQRLGLAAALLVPRKLVVLDEPTNGLDPAGTREIRRIVGDLKAKGVTVVVSSHLLSEIEAICTHVVVMNRGTVVTHGALDELLAAGNPSLLITTPDANAALAALRQQRMSAQLAPTGVLVDLAAVTAPEVVATLVRAGVEVHEARREQVGLDNWFAQLTEEPAEVPDPVAADLDQIRESA